jgi:hypothetical protein
MNKKNSKVLLKIQRFSKKVKTSKTTCILPIIMEESINEKSQTNISLSKQVCAPDNMYQKNNKKVWGGQLAFMNPFSDKS